MTWPTVRLGDVASIQRNIIQPEDIVSGELYVGLENIKSGGQFNNVQPVKKGDLASSKFAFTNKHLLYGKLRPYLAKIAIPNFNGICSTDILPVLPSNELDLRYLAHVLLQPQLVAIANSLATGANLPRLSPTALSDLKIPLPPLPEQQRIAAILDKAEEIKRKREQAIAKLDELAQSTFVEMFGDPIKNCKEWEITKLEKIANVGSSKRVFVEELTDVGVPFYRGTEIGALGAGEVIEPSLFISKSHYERLKLESGVPKKGDLLLPSICHDGRIYLVEDDNQFYFKDGRVLWIGLAGDDVNSYFLRELLKKIFAKNYSKIASGTTFAELKIFALKELDIIKPPIMLQIKYGDFVRSLKTERKKMVEDLRKNKELVASLQHQAFTTGFNA